MRTPIAQKSLLKFKINLNPSSSFSEQTWTPTPIDKVNLQYFFYNLLNIFIFHFINSFI